MAMNYRYAVEAEASVERGVFGPYRRRIKGERRCVLAVRRAG